MEYFDEQVFEQKDYNTTPIEIGEYEDCTFINCNFSSSDLSKLEFTNCEFVDCNLSNVKLNKTMFQEVHFKSCKMLGLLFDNCNLFGFSVKFTDCFLNHSSFYQKKLPKTIFKNTQLQYVDFTESDLSQALFENCDLLKSKFERTNLTKANFTTSYNYSLDPEINIIKKAIFSLENIKGLLMKYDIEIK